MTEVSAVRGVPLGPNDAKVGHAFPSAFTRQSFDGDACMETRPSLEERLPLITMLHAESFSGWPADVPIPSWERDPEAALAQALAAEASGNLSVTSWSRPFAPDEVDLTRAMVQGRVRLNISSVDFSEPLGPDADPEQVSLRVEAMRVMLMTWAAPPTPAYAGKRLSISFEVREVDDASAGGAPPAGSDASTAQRAASMVATAEVVEAAAASAVAAGAGVVLSEDCDGGDGGDGDGDADGIIVI